MPDQRTVEGRWRDTPTIPMTAERAQELLTVLLHGRERGISEQWACITKETLEGFLRLQSRIDETVEVLKTSESFKIGNPTVLKALRILLQGKE